MVLKCKTWREVHYSPIITLPRTHISETNSRTNLDRRLLYENIDEDPRDFYRFDTFYTGVNVSIS